MMIPFFRSFFIFAFIFCGFAPAYAHGGFDFYQIRTCADSGDGSLREAIINANDDPQTQIAFQIPNTDSGYNLKTGVFTIELLSPLPLITAKGTVFDGVAQNIVADSNRSGPEICISGAKLPRNTSGLVFLAADCEIKGLTFSDFASHALIFNGPDARGNRVLGCTFEKNRGCGVVLSDGASNNFIGLAPPRAKNDDDDFAGFYPAQMGNIFRGNGEDFVRIAGQNSRGNSVRGNRFEGTSMPLNLRLNGEKNDQRTPNDALDADSGPNDAFNFPIIQSVKRAPREDGVWHEITVNYAGKPNQNLVLDVSWEAQLAIDGTMKSQNVRTDAAGKGFWKMQVQGYPAGKMRAAVTDENGSTGEMSPVFDVPYLQ
ncbi:hypothetical protein [Abditibacterium utsteinense]|nr:hypothetical protein [Abditibacterium utsteinense]